MNAERRAELTEEHALLVEVVESLNARSLTDAATRIDRDSAIADEIIASIEQAGLFQLLLSTLDCPQDAAPLSVLVIDRVATASPAAAMLVGAAHAATAAVLKGDDPARLDSYRRLAFVDGEQDLIARDDGRSGWVLDGLVEPCVGALGADALIVVTRGPDDEPLTLLLAPDSHGVTVEPAAARTGLRGAGLARVRFKSAGAQAQARIGGRESALAGARHAALAVAAAAAGVAEAAVEQARIYLRQRHQFGQALADFAGLRAMIGQMAAQRDAAWALTELAARTQQAAMAHRAAAVATQTATDIALDALQLHGGYGYTQDFAIERCLRDAVSLRARAGGLRTHLTRSADDVLGVNSRRDTDESFATAVEGITR